MIKITRLIKKQNKFYVYFKVGKTIKKYFNHNVLVFKYKINILKIPNSILLIPAISNLLPVAWFNKCDLETPYIDTNYLKSIMNIFEVINKKFKLKSNSKIIFKKNISYKEEFNKNNFDEICLFSGGVDSTSLVSQKINIKPYLLIADYEPSGIHNKVYEFANSLVGKNKVQTVKSNLYSFLHRKQLDKDFGSFTNGTWWGGGVQHGIGLLSLAAPITWYYNIKKINIASTHTQQFNHNWGSDPAIDNKLKWHNTKCEHAQFKITRFEKIKIYIKKLINQKKITLAVCNSYSRRKNEINCSKCQKCAQAILGLIYNNLNPNYCGFKVNDNTFNWIEESLQSRTFFARKSDFWIWNDLKSKLKIKNKNKLVNYKHSLFKYFENLKLNYSRDFHSNLVITDRPGYKKNQI